MPTEQLTERQRELLDGWLPGSEVVRDLSWGLVGTTVLEVRHAGASYVVKAGDHRDHHLAREVRAHREWLRPWTAAGRAPELAHADPGARLLVTRFLPGVLVEGAPQEWEPETYRQAGRLLADLHGQLAEEDPAYEAREQVKALEWLDRPHRIDPGVERRLREVVTRWPAPPTTVVPTHGDWHPRNWLVDEGLVRVIDFGRAALRPAATDLARLAARQFRADPALEVAFLEGYGPDPRRPESWHQHRIREAIGTAVWAYQVGDERFEQQGHRMITEALSMHPGPGGRAK